MSNQDLYEIYRKLAACRDGQSDVRIPLAEFAKVCRERQLSLEEDEWKDDIRNCLREIAANPRAQTQALLEWLTTDEDIRTGRALVSEAGVLLLRAREPVRFDLAGVNTQQALLAGARLSAFALCPPLSLGWALSLLENSSLEDRAHQAAVGLLEYHVEEYPRSTKRLLENSSSTYLALEEAQQALTYLTELSRQIDELPRLRELAMSPAMRIAYAHVRRTENRQINRTANEKSVIAQLFTTHHFKYSNRAAVEFQVGAESKDMTLEMQPYSVEYELPQSEKTDPTKGEIRRSQLSRGVIK